MILQLKRLARKQIVDLMKYFSFDTAYTSADDITAVRNEAYAITTSQHVAYRSLQPDDRTVQETPASDADGYDYVSEQAVVVYEEIETP